MGVSLMTDQEIVKKVGSYVEVHLPEWIKSVQSGGSPENLDSAGSAGDVLEAAGEQGDLTAGPAERTGGLEEATNKLTEVTLGIADALKKQGDLIVSLAERTGGLEEVTKKLAERTGGLEEVSKQLAERTGALENAIEKQGEWIVSLAERTGGLEEVTKKLAERTEELSGRMIRVEEAIAGFTQGMSDFRVEMKQQGKRIDVMNERLIQLEESNRNQVNLVEKLLHQMDKRFEQTDKRFEEVHKRFGQLITAVVAGFGVISGLVTIYKFFG